MYGKGSYIFMFSKLKSKFKFKAKPKSEVRSKNRKSFLLDKFNLRNRNIGAKYSLVLGIIITLFIISSVIVVFQLQTIEKNVNDLEQIADETANVIEVGSLIRGKGIRSSNYSNNPTKLYTEEFKMLDDQIQELNAVIQKTLRTAEQRKLYEEIVTYNDEMNELFLTGIVEAINNREVSKAISANHELYQLTNKTIDRADQLADLLKDSQGQSVKKAQQSKEITFIILIASTLISIAVSIILIYFISRGVTRNLNEIVTASNRIAQNDLSIDEIQYDGNDEIGKLALAMNTMNHNLRQMVIQLLDVSGTTSSQSEELTQTANQVMAGSEQIASTMQDLSSGTVSQADHTSELSSGMEDFSNKINAANDNGSAIQQASERVYKMTTEGSKLMEISASQMNRIDEIMRQAVVNVQNLDTQAQRISELVSVIQTIASQTNLLALNAAIEAARAGEHGRGFAVVADEVRRLAEDVSISVTDITGIVDSIQQESSQVTESLEIGYKEVEQGTSQIQETTETFTDISTAIEDMVVSIQVVIANLADMSNDSDSMLGAIQEISAVAEESAAGIEQTSASSQETSSSMEEIASSSEDLAVLAEELNNLIKEFKL